MSAEALLRLAAALAAVGVAAFLIFRVLRRSSAPPRFVRIHNTTRDTLLGSHVRIADDPRNRLIGLLGQPSLPPGSGLWIRPSNSIHTIGMKFAFDVVLIDRDCRVVGLREGIRPFRVALPCWKAESVLELPATTLARTRTRVGDQLSIERS
jgi:hypothetical protein